MRVANRFRTCMCSSLVEDNRGATDGVLRLAHQHDCSTWHTHGGSLHYQWLTHASLPAGDASTPVVPPSGYKYEAQVEFVDHVTAADPKGSFAAAAVQEVCPALQFCKQCCNVSNLQEKRELADICPT